MNPRDSLKLRGCSGSSLQQKAEIRENHRSLWTAFSHKGAACLKNLHKMLQKQVFPIIHMKRNPEVWGKPTENQDEQTEPLILENVNNIGSRRVSYSPYSWRFLAGTQSTNCNNKRLLWKITPVKSLKLVFITTESKYSTQD